VERLKQEGTSHSSSDLLKINGKMGPEDFAYIFFTDLDYRLRTVVRREGEGVDGCVVRRSEWVWGVRPGFCFQTCSRTRSGLQPVVDWPQCRGVGSCSW